jgi:hypothetical protein
VASWLTSLWVMDACQVLWGGGEGSEPFICQETFLCSKDTPQASPPSISPPEKGLFPVSSYCHSSCCS